MTHIGKPYNPYNTYFAKCLSARHIMSTSKSMAHTKDLVVSTRQCIKVRSGRTYCLHQWIGNAWNIGANGSKSEQDTRKLNKNLGVGTAWG
jgi:hypothetical protein